MITLEEDYAAWVAYRKARKDKKGGRGVDDRSKTGRSKPKEEGRTRMDSKGKLGIPTGVTPVISSFTTHPSVQTKTVALAVHLRTKGWRRSLPVNLIPLSLWNPLWEFNRAA